MSSASRNVFRMSAAMLLVAISCIVSSCKQEENEPAGKRTGRPAEAAAETSAPDGELLEALDRIGPPPNPDPQTRPLILSRPAANRREWALRALLEGYHDTGRTGPWDAKVERAFEAYCDYSRVSTDHWPALEQALAALENSGCDDPMIRYMRARYAQTPRSTRQQAMEYLAAHDAMVHSRHHPVFKFFSGWRAVAVARDADRNTPRTTRVKWTTASLEDALRDTNAPPDEVFDIARSWLDHSGIKSWLDYVMGHVTPLIEKNWSRTEPYYRFQGFAEIELAWGERGGGYAASVSERGFRGFTEHLERAEEMLATAWEMDSRNPQTSYLMMRVELGQGRGLDRMEKWFNECMRLYTNNHDAASLMSFYLEPRWYGSEEAALAFGRKCVASTKWGGTVPLVLAELHRSLARYNNLANSPTYWHRTQVWKDVQSSYQKFFALNPQAVGYRHNYARDAFQCGQYAVFLEQVKQFTAGTNHAFFGGEEHFRHMLQQAAASQSRAR